MIRNGVIRGARRTRGIMARGGVRIRNHPPSIRSFSAQPLAPSSSTSLPTKTTENLPSSPIDFDVASKIEGEESQVATIELRPGETLRAESGAMLYMTEGVAMETKLEGMSSAMARMMTGQNLFLTDYRYEGDTTGTVCLGTAFPSKIMRFQLSHYPDATLICQKGAFLASNTAHGVHLTMEFTKSLTAGFFGGEGFVLQRLSGQGDVLLQGGGTIVRRDLEPGETLRVTSGSVVTFTSTVQYDVQVMPGVQNAMFGGEGLFVTTLTGPGQVWLQGMSPDRMIAEIASRVPAGSGLGVMPVMMGGGSGGEATADGASATGADETTPLDEAAAATGGGVAETGSSASATDAAIEADRNATVASSGMSSSPDDVDSSAALFGDAVPSDVTGTTSVSSPPASTERTTDPFAEPKFDDDTSFSTEASVTQEEPSFDDTSTSTDDFSSFDDSNSTTDGGLFSDPGTSSSSDAGEEDSSGMFQTLWDMFTGDD